MQAPNPDYRKAVGDCFAQAAFVPDVGIMLADCGPGWCESVLQVAPRHLQHTGVIHAGVQTTMADHTAGAAAITLAREDEIILTVEFKVHLLRPGIGEQLWCRAQVLKPGRNFHVVESEVYALAGDKKSLVSKLTGTMAVLQAQR
ncbi:MAG TPA: PaaI family thioesterase [Noviherbaspirillum sp.]|nr:PaaI family thioesterase [Noviherbaspirillum sp.]